MEHTAAQFPLSDSVQEKDNFDIDGEDDAGAPRETAPGATPESVGLKHVI